MVTKVTSADLEMSLWTMSLQMALLYDISPPVLLAKQGCMRYSTLFFQQ